MVRRTLKPKSTSMRDHYGIVAAGFYYVAGRVDALLAVGTRCCGGCNKRSWCARSRWQHQPRRVWGPNAQRRHRRAWLVWHKASYLSTTGLVAIWLYPIDTRLTSSVAWLPDDEFECQSIAGVHVRLQLGMFCSSLKYHLMVCWQVMSIIPLRVISQSIIIFIPVVWPLMPIWPIIWNKNLSCCLVNSLQTWEEEGMQHMIHRPLQ